MEIFDLPPMLKGNEQDMPNMRNYLIRISEEIKRLERDFDSIGNIEKILSTFSAEVGKTETKLRGVVEKYMDKIYPVGSIYLSTSSTSPSNFIGGTWEQIEDCFLLAAGSTYTAGDTGGSAKHKHTTEASTTGGTAITVNQMPSHSHKIRLYANAGEVAQGWNTVDNVNQKSTWTTAPVESTGGGQAHTHTQVAVDTDEKSNIPPYLAVYVWKRIA